MTAHNDTADTFIIATSIIFYIYVVNQISSLPICCSHLLIGHLLPHRFHFRLHRDHSLILVVVLAVALLVRITSTYSTLRFWIRVLHWGFVYMMTGYGEFDHSSVRAFEGPIFSCNLVYNGNRKTDIPIDPPSFYTWQPALLPDETLRVLRLATREK